MPGWIATGSKRRMKPSGQQYCEGHCEAAITPSWYRFCTMRFWYSGVSRDRMVGIWLTRMLPYQFWPPSP
jgi:hypothetical protein